jgi:hypothetical protein
MKTEETEGRRQQTALAWPVIYPKWAVITATAPAGFLLEPASPRAKAQVFQQD